MVQCTVYNNEGSVRDSFILDPMSNAIKTCRDLVGKEGIGEARLVGEETVVLGKLSNGTITETHYITDRSISAKLKMILRGALTAAGLEVSGQACRDYLVYTDEKGTLRVDDSGKYPPVGGIDFVECDKSGAGMEHMKMFIHLFNKLTGMGVEYISYIFISDMSKSSSVAYMPSSRDSGMALVKVK